MNHEFDAIAEYFQNPATHRHSTTVVGNGDDASVHHIPDGYALVMSTDTAIESVHWPKAMPLNIAGNRAVHAALSDLAAMGATPAWLWLAITARDMTALQAMSKGIVQACGTHHLELAGGDTTCGNTNTITVTAGGLVPQGKAMLRTLAQEGDEVWLLGDVGLAAAGLKQWLDDKRQGCFVPYFERIQPRYTQGERLRQAGVRCCMDVSDGLLQDAGHIATASQLQIQIDLEHIRQLDCYQKLTSYFDAETSLKKVLSGGEDYALLCTAPPELRQDLLKLQAVRIGNCLPGEGVHLTHRGQVIDYNIKGFDHFA